MEDWASKHGGLTNDCMRHKCCGDSPANRGFTINNLAIETCQGVAVAASTHRFSPDLLKESVATSRTKRLARFNPPKLHREALFSRRLLLEHLEDRRLLAVIQWDGGPDGAGTKWSDPVNWVGDELTGSAGLYWFICSDNQDKATDVSANEFADILDFILSGL